MHIDKFLFNILDEYNGFNYHSSLSEDEARLEMAKYAMACLHDTELAEEAAKICEGANCEEAN